MKPLPITEFDRLTIPSNIQLLKALMPFFDYNLQQSLAPVIRIYELTYTNQYYQTPNNLNINACSSKPRICLSSPVSDILCDEEIQNAIMPYCPEDFKQLLSSLNKTNSLSDLFNSKCGELALHLNEVMKSSDVLNINGHKKTPD